MPGPLPIYALARSVLSAEPTGPSCPRVLLLDPNKLLRTALSDLLRSNGIHVVAAVGDLASAASIIREGQLSASVGGDAEERGGRGRRVVDQAELIVEGPTVVVADQHEYGLGLISELRAADPRLKVIIQTATLGEEDQARVHLLGGFALIGKGYTSPQVLLETIADAHKLYNGAP